MTDKIRHYGANMTFLELAEIFDAGWTIRKLVGTSPDGETQTLHLEIKVAKRKGVSDVYREGIAGHSHANWMIEGGYVDDSVL